jgi:hypothetical protein
MNELNISLKQFVDIFSASELLKYVNSENDEEKIMIRKCLIIFQNTVSQIYLQNGLIDSDIESILDSNMEQYNAIRN